MERKGRKREEKRKKKESKKLVPCGTQFKFAIRKRIQPKNFKG